MHNFVYTAGRLFLASARIKKLSSTYLEDQCRDWILFPVQDLHRRVIVSITQKYQNARTLAGDHQTMEVRTAYDDILWNNFAGNFQAPNPEHQVDQGTAGVTGARGQVPASLQYG